MKTLLSSLLLACAASGCALSPSSEQESTDDSVVESEDGLTAAQNSGYYVVTRRDFRRCMAPFCGGYFVKRVNAETTRCADGQLGADCYVSEIDIQKLGLSERERADLEASQTPVVLKATMLRRRLGGARYGVLRATEAWMSATGAPLSDGLFVRAADSGIRCIQAPCPSTTAYVLNSRDRQNVIDVVLDNTTPSAPEGLLNDARNMLWTETGILVRGSLITPRCLPQGESCGPKVIASDFYLPVVHREGESCGGFRMQPEPCGRNQFCQWQAGALCGAADAPGICAYRTEVCIALYKPVCGCDGKTYGNSCEATAAGASVLRDGECTN